MDCISCEIDMNFTNFKLLQSTPYENVNEYIMLYLMNAVMYIDVNTWDSNRFLASILMFNGKFYKNCIQIDICFGFETDCDNAHCFDIQPINKSSLFIHFSHARIIYIITLHNGVWNIKHIIRHTTNGKLFACNNALWILNNHNIEQLWPDDNIYIIHPKFSGRPTIDIQLKMNEFSVGTFEQIIYTIKSSLEGYSIELKEKYPMYTRLKLASECNYGYIPKCNDILKYYFTNKYIIYNDNIYINSSSRPTMFMKDDHYNYYTITNKYVITYHEHDIYVQKLPNIKNIIKRNNMIKDELISLEIFC